MPETTRLKIALLIHDLKAPLAVIDLGARSLKERKTKYGPLTYEQENTLDHLLQRTESLRREVNRALSSRQNAGSIFPTGRLRGMLKRLTPGTNRSEKSVPRVSAETQALDATSKLLLDIEAHLLGIRETVDLFGKADPAPGIWTAQQERVLRRFKRSIKLALILIGNAKILAFPRGMESQPGRVRLREAIRGPLVETFDLYYWQIADQVEKLMTAEDLTRLVATAGLTLQIEAGLLDRECILDKDKFSQVMVNLLLNAFKFRKKFVWLSLKELNQNLLLSVMDDGEGMSEEVSRAVLAGRFQAGSDTGLPIQSHGIGLAGAHVLIKEMGGGLAIESTLGEGSKVSVTIPCFKNEF